MSFNSEDLAVDVKEDCGSCTISPATSTMSVGGKDTSGMWGRMFLHIVLKRRCY